MERVEKTNRFKMQFELIQELVEALKARNNTNLTDWVLNNQEVLKEIQKVLPEAVIVLKRAGFEDKLGLTPFIYSQVMTEVHGVNYGHRAKSCARGNKCLVIQ